MITLKYSSCKLFTWPISNRNGSVILVTEFMYHHQQNKCYPQRCQIVHSQTFRQIIKKNITIVFNNLLLYHLFVPNSCSEYFNFDKQFFFVTRVKCH